MQKRREMRKKKRRRREERDQMRKKIRIYLYLSQDGSLPTYRVLHLRHMIQ